MKRIRDKFRKKCSSRSLLDLGSTSRLSESSSSSSSANRNISQTKSSSDITHLMVPKNDTNTNRLSSTSSSSSSSSSAAAARQIRSVSCDEISLRQNVLESNKLLQPNSTSNNNNNNNYDSNNLNADNIHTNNTKQTPSSHDHLEIPSNTGKSGRSKSFDSTLGKKSTAAGKHRSTSGSISFLEIPKWRLFIRRSSSQSSGRLSPTLPSPADKCVHCSLNNELIRQQVKMRKKEQQQQQRQQKQLKDDDENKSMVISKSCSFDSDIAISSGLESSYDDDDENDDDAKSSGTKSDSELITRDIEHVIGGRAKEGRTRSDSDAQCLLSSIDGSPLVTLSVAPIEIIHGDIEFEDSGNGITVISLEVPITKQNRSASIDASFLKVPEVMSTRMINNSSPVSRSHRSHSVDISLPTIPDGPYLIVQNTRPEPIFLK